MILEETKLPGVYIINNFNASDCRGEFIKTYHKETFKKNKISFEIRESYYSISNKDVIRGMHFQLPPHDHQKLIYVSVGEIIDVILDLRKNSPTFKQFISVKISDKNKKSIFIPKGLAHGFRSIKDDTVTVYNVSKEYNFDFDFGLKFDSFGFDWNLKEPILSKRDNEFISFQDFNTPFL